LLDPQRGFCHSECPAPFMYAWAGSVDYYCIGDRLIVQLADGRDIVIEEDGSCDTLRFEGGLGLGVKGPRCIVSDDGCKFGISTEKTKFLAYLSSIEFQGDHPRQAQLREILACENEVEAFELLVKFVDESPTLGFDAEDLIEATIRGEAEALTGQAGFVPNSIQGPTLNLIVAMGKHDGEIAQDSVGEGAHLIETARIPALIEYFNLSDDQERREDARVEYLNAFRRAVAAKRSRS